MTPTRPEIHLWLREDGEPPKALQAGTRPPGPGRVVAVRVAKLGGAPANEARAIVARALAPEQDFPDLDAIADPAERDRMVEAFEEAERERERAQRAVHHVGIYVRRQVCEEHLAMLTSPTAPPPACPACAQGVIVEA